MPNDAARAEFWKDFILRRGHYPAPERLRAQFAATQIDDFCQCGCNSFDASIPDGKAVPPLVPAGGSGMFFEANFRIEDSRQLEVLIFVDEKGNLSGVDIQCQGNTEPVPDDLSLSEEPFYTYTSDQLLR